MAKTKLLRVVLFLLTASLLSLHIYSFYPFLTDDALISLQYSRQLLKGDGLTWSGGQLVEGYSNLLWVLVVAFGGLFHPDLIFVLRVLGVLCTLVTLGLLISVQPTLSLAAVGALIFSIHGVVAAWAIGGLEQPLLLLLLSSGLFSISKRERGGGDYWLLVSAISFGLMTVTRSDGILFPAAATVGLAYRYWWRDPQIAKRYIISILGIAALFYLLQTGFRLWYYGEWFSNVARVKIAFTSDRILLGLRYIGRGLGTLYPWSIIAVFSGLSLFRTDNPSAVEIIAFFQLIVWIIYILLIGGDVNPPSRHFVPVVFLLSVLIPPSLESLREGIRVRTWLSWFSILSIGFIFYGVLQLVDLENADARSNNGVRECRVFADLLKVRLKGIQAVLAVDNAGCLPYFSEIPSIDMLGLNDVEIALAVSKDLGEGWIGHEVGDGGSVLRRRPDIVIFCSGLGSKVPCWRGGIEMVKDHIFQEDYRLLEALVEDKVAYIWIRKDRKDIEAALNVFSQRT